jgi:disulfide bond formation protein DsbB
MLGINKIGGTSMRLAVLALVAGVALLATACGGGGGGGGGGADSVAQGKAEFRKTCATCHGPEAEGMPRLGKNLHDNEFVRSQSDEALLQFLKEGRPATHPDNDRGVDMPPKGGNPAITDEQLALIVAYMRSIA